MAASVRILSTPTGVGLIVRAGAPHVDPENLEQWTFSLLPGTVDASVEHVTLEVRLRSAAADTTWTTRVTTEDFSDCTDKVTVETGTASTTSSDYFVYTTAPDDADTLVYKYVRVPIALFRGEDARGTGALEITFAASTFQTAIETDDDGYKVARRPNPLGHAAGAWSPDTAYRLYMRMNPDAEAPASFHVLRRVHDAAASSSGVFVPSTWGEPYKTSLFAANDYEIGYFAGATDTVGGEFVAMLADGRMALPASGDPSALPHLTLDYQDNTLRVGTQSIRGTIHVLPLRAHTWYALGSGLSVSASDDDGAAHPAHADTPPRTAWLYTTPGRVLRLHVAATEETMTVRAIEGEKDGLAANRTVVTADEQGRPLRQTVERTGNVRVEYIGYDVDYDETDEPWVYEENIVPHAVLDPMYQKDTDHSFVDTNSRSLYLKSEYHEDAPSASTPTQLVRSITIRPSRAREGSELELRIRHVGDNVQLQNVPDGFWSRDEDGDDIVFRATVTSTTAEGSVAPWVVVSGEVWKTTTDGSTCVVDRTPPVLTSSSDATTSFTQTQISRSFSAASDWVDHFQVSADDVAATVELVTDPLPAADDNPSTYTLEFEARDDAGNVGQLERAIEVTADPAIVIASNLESITHIDGTAGTLNLRDAVTASNWNTVQVIVNGSDGDYMTQLPTQQEVEDGMTVQVRFRNFAGSIESSMATVRARPRVTPRPATVFVGRTLKWSFEVETSSAVTVTDTLSGATLSYEQKDGTDIYVLDETMIPTEAGTLEKPITVTNAYGGSVTATLTAEVRAVVVVDPAAAFDLRGYADASLSEVAYSAADLAAAEPYFDDGDSDAATILEATLRTDANRTLAGSDADAAGVPFFRWPQSMFTARAVVGVDRRGGELVGDANLDATRRRYHVRLFGADAFDFQCGGARLDLVLRLEVTDGDRARVGLETLGGTNLIAPTTHAIAADAATAPFVVAELVVARTGTTGPETTATLRLVATASTDSYYGVGVPDADNDTDLLPTTAAVVVDARGFQLGAGTVSAAAAGATEAYHSRVSLAADPAIPGTCLDLVLREPTDARSPMEAIMMSLDEDRLARSWVSVVGDRVVEEDSTFRSRVDAGSEATLAPTGGFAADSRRPVRVRSLRWCGASALDVDLLGVNDDDEEVVLQRLELRPGEEWTSEGVVLSRSRLGTGGEEPDATNAMDTLALRWEQDVAGVHAVRVVPRGAEDLRQVSLQVLQARTHRLRVAVPAAARDVHAGGAAVAGRLYHIASDGGPGALRQRCGAKMTVDGVLEVRSNGVPDHAVWVEGLRAIGDTRDEATDERGGPFPDGLTERSHIFRWTSEDLAADGPDAEDVPTTPEDLQLPSPGTLVGVARNGVPLVHFGHTLPETTDGYGGAAWKQGHYAYARLPVLADAGVRTSRAIRGIRALQLPPTVDFARTYAGASRTDARHYAVYPRAPNFTPLSGEPLRSFDLTFKIGIFFDVLQKDNRERSYDVHLRSEDGTDRRMRVTYYAELDNDMPADRKWILGSDAELTAEHRALFAAYIAEAHPTDLETTGFLDQDWTYRQVSQQGYAEFFALIWRRVRLHLKVEAPFLATPLEHTTEWGSPLFEQYADVALGASALVNQWYRSKVRPAYAPHVCTLRLRRTSSEDAHTELLVSVHHAGRLPRVRAPPSGDDRVELASGRVLATKTPHEIHFEADAYGLSEVAYARGLVNYERDGVLGQGYYDFEAGSTDSANFPLEHMYYLRRYVSSQGRSFLRDDDSFPVAALLSAGATHAWPAEDMSGRTYSSYDVTAQKTSPWTVERHDIFTTSVRFLHEDWADVTSVRLDLASDANPDYKFWRPGASVCHQSTAHAGDFFSSRKQCYFFALTSMGAGTTGENRLRLDHGTAPGTFEVGNNVRLRLAAAGVDETVQVLAVPSPTTVVVSSPTVPTELELTTLKDVARRVAEQPDALALLYDPAHAPRLRDPSKHPLNDLVAAGGHSPLLGVATDGYPIYGPVGTSETSWSTAAPPPTRLLVSAHDPHGDTDLDARNGIFSATPEYPTGVYHYVCPVRPGATAPLESVVRDEYNALIERQRYRVRVRLAPTPAVATGDRIVLRSRSVDPSVEVATTVGAVDADANTFFVFCVDKSDEPTLEATFASFQSEEILSAADEETRLLGWTMHRTHVMSDDGRLVRDTASAAYSVQAAVATRDPVETGLTLAEKFVVRATVEPAYPFLPVPPPAAATRLAGEQDTTTPVALQFVAPVAYLSQHYTHTVSSDMFQRDVVGGGQETIVTLVDKTTGSTPVLPLTVNGADQEITVTYTRGSASLSRDVLVRALRLDVRPLPAVVHTSLGALQDNDGGADPQPVMSLSSNTHLRSSNVPTASLGVRVDASDAGNPYGLVVQDGMVTCAPTTVPEAATDMDATVVWFLRSGATVGGSVFEERVDLLSIPITVRYTPPLSDPLVDRAASVSWIASSITLPQLAALERAGREQRLALPADVTVNLTGGTETLGAAELDIFRLGSGSGLVPVVLRAPALAVEALDYEAVVETTATTRLTVRAVSTRDTTLQYQWHRNGVAIPGATLAGYDAPAEASDATYHVVVRGVQSRLRTRSAAATVRRVRPISFTRELPSYQQISGDGGTVVLRVGVAGAALLRWSKDGASLAAQEGAEELEVNSTGTYRATLVDPTTNSEAASTACVVTRRAPADDLAVRLVDLPHNATLWSRVVVEGIEPVAEPFAHYDRAANTYAWPVYRTRGAAVAASPVSGAAPVVGTSFFRALGLTGSAAAAASGEPPRGLGVVGELVVDGSSTTAFDVRDDRVFLLRSVLTTEAFDLTYQVDRWSGTEWVFHDTDRITNLAFDGRINLRRSFQRYLAAQAAHNPVYDELTIANPTNSTEEKTSYYPLSYRLTAPDSWNIGGATGAGSNRLAEVEDPRLFDLQSRTLADSSGNRATVLGFRSDYEMYIRFDDDSAGTTFNSNDVVTGFFAAQAGVKVNTDASEPVTFASAPTHVSDVVAEVATITAMPSTRRLDLVPLDAATTLTVELTTTTMQGHLRRGAIETVSLPEVQLERFDAPEITPLSVEVEGDTRLIVFHAGSGDLTVTAANATGIHMAFE